MKISTSQFFTNASRQMIENQNRLSDVQRELATGRKIQNASDAPDKVSMLQRVQGLLLEHEAHQKNIESTNQRLQTQETAIRNASNLLIRLREIATQFSNETYTPAQRLSAASEAHNIRDQLLALANSKDSNAKSVFAGSQIGKNAYSIDGIYQGDQVGISVEIGGSFQLKTLRDGSTIFRNAIRDDGNGNTQSIGFFQVIDEIISGLEVSDLEAIRRGIGETQKLHLGITESLSAIGTQMKTIQDQSSILDEQGLRLTSLQSNLQDVDYAEAITRMQKEMMGLQAAQSSFAQISKLSLFNFMN
jgi:flagellar hook-associated protein 3 FlgL